MSKERDLEYADSMMTQIGRLMVNIGNHQMINQLQKEMSRYSVPLQTVDENQNIAVNNSYYVSNTRKRVRECINDDIIHGTKSFKGPKTTSKFCYLMLINCHAVKWHPMIENFLKE